MHIERRVGPHNNLQGGCEVQHWWIEVLKEEKEKIHIC
jgi:hypothetical protein